MRLLLVLFALPALQGCGGTNDADAEIGGFGLFLNADNFTKKFQTKFCDELAECSQGEMTCDQIGVTTTTTVPNRCDFDRSAARECLKGDWSCDGDFGFPITPTACASVFTNCGSTFSTGTDF